MSALTLQHNLSTQLAAAITTNVCNFAAREKLNICVSVLDRYGYPLAFQRMENAPLHSIQIAEDKAFTAVSFGFETHLWQERLKENGHLRQALSQQPRLLMIGGGLPLICNDERVGAIGVSGASEQQDIACATAGQNTFLAEINDA